MARWMINCKEYSILASEDLDRNLSFWERVSVRFHQIICPPCDLFRQQLNSIRTACRAAQTKDGTIDPEACRLPDDVRERIKTVIKDLPAEKQVR